MTRLRKNHHKTCTPVKTKWFKTLSFLARTSPNTTENLQACEKILQAKLIPNLIDKDKISHQLRDIASLPLKMGGVNIKLTSNNETFLEKTVKTSSVIGTCEPLKAVSEQ